MKTVGIVAEYNPLHLGHSRQFGRIRREFGGETAIVCAMSGNYVQRGAPAIVDKTLRAKAAVLCGADLVVELPTTVSLSSAEGFAAGGVGILSTLCDTLCFGAETADGERLMGTARALLSEAFPPLLRQTRHSSGLASTRIISGPMRQMHFQGMIKSSCLPATPRTRQGPGTTMAVTDPSGTSTSTSDTNPSRRPSDTQITSLHCSWVNFIPIAIPPLCSGAGYAAGRLDMPGISS